MDGYRNWQNGEQILYNKDGILTNVGGDSRAYDPDGWLQSYADASGTQSNACDATGALYQHSSNKTSSPAATANIQYAVDAMGQFSAQNANYANWDAKEGWQYTNDNLYNIGYALYGARILSLIGGIRTNKYGPGAYTAVNATFDDKGHPQGRQGTSTTLAGNTENFQEVVVPTYTLIDSGYDGMVFRKRKYSFSPVMQGDIDNTYLVPILQVCEYAYFFHDLRGNYEGSLGNIQCHWNFHGAKGSFSVGYNDISESWSRGGGMVRVDTASAYNAKNEGWSKNGMVLVDSSRPYSGNSSKINPTFPAPASDTAVAQSGDNFYTIAQRVYGNPQPAPDIAALNDYNSPGDQPPAGQRLLLPQFTPMEDTAEDNLPADEAARITAGSLQLSVMHTKQPPPPPPPHHSLLGDLIDTFVQVAAVALGVIGKFGGPEGVLIATVTAVLVDAAGQLLEDALGLRKGISWRELLDTGLEAATADMALGAASSLGMDLLRAGVENLAEQGLNMMDGGEKSFSLTAFTESVAEAGIDDEIDPELGKAKISPRLDPSVNTGVNNFLNEGIADRGHWTTFDLEDDLVEMLGTGLADEATTAMRPKASKLEHELDNYVKASKAAKAAPNRHMQMKETSNTVSNSNRAHPHPQHTAAHQAAQHPAAKAKTPSAEYAKQTQAEVKPKKPSRAERWNPQTKNNGTWENRQASRLSKALTDLDDMDAGTQYQALVALGMSPKHAAAIVNQGTPKVTGHPLVPGHENAWQQRGEEVITEGPKAVAFLATMAVAAPETLATLGAAEASGLSLPELASLGGKSILESAGKLAGRVGLWRGASTAKSGVEKLDNLAHNRTLHESYKANLRQNMEKPTVQHPKLRNIVKELYKPNAKVGSGSTADAIREETGMCQGK